VSLHGKNGLSKKKKEKCDVVTRFWYTLKNLDPEIKIWFNPKLSVEHIQTCNKDVFGVQAWVFLITLSSKSSKQVENFVSYLLCTIHHNHYINW
jgi:hypothetical protein